MSESEILVEAPGSGEVEVSDEGKAKEVSVPEISPQISTTDEIASDNKKGNRSVPFRLWLKPQPNTGKSRLKPTQNRRFN